MDKPPPKPDCPSKPEKPDCPPPEPTWNVWNIHKEKTQVETNVTNNVTINHNEQIINRVRVINYCHCGGGGCGSCSFRRVDVAPCYQPVFVPPPRYDCYEPPMHRMPPPWHHRRMDYDYDYGRPPRLQPLVWYPDRMPVDIQPMPWYPDRMPIYIQPVPFYPQDDYYGRPPRHYQPRPRYDW